MRFRPEQHLHRAREIRTVRERGRRIEGRAFTLWWKRREPTANSVPAAEVSRVCVIASSAAVGAATRRNRAKRRLREIFRHEQNHVPPGCDLLLIARAAVNEWPMPELQQKFIEVCRQMAAAAALPPK